jgi:hypothetical protein
VPVAVGDLHQCVVDHRGVVGGIVRCKRPSGLGWLPMQDPSPS